MKWVIGLLCLIFLILFHELGHFIAAKLCGVKVESFSIGFGPVLLHKTIKGTDYRISLFPLGGYCGMKGENDFQTAIEEKLPYIKGEKDSLFGVHPLKRAFIGFAGPFFNFIFAIILASLINLIGFNYYSFSNQIRVYDDVTELNFSSCPAKDAGLQNEDKIIKINNTEIINFQDIIKEVSTHPDENIEITVLRNNEILNFTAHTLLNKETGAGFLGIQNFDNTYLEFSSPKYNFFTAFGKGILDTFDYISITFKSIGLLFKGVNIKNAVSGPLRVTDLLGSTIQDSFKVSTKIGFINMFQILCIISISLFIMNLLPIPILDGGLILFALIEAIAHKKINPKFQYYIQYIGLAFIVVLFCIGMFGDISYFINRGKN